MQKFRYLMVGVLIGATFFPVLAFASKAFTVEPVSVKYIINGKTHSPATNQQSFQSSGTTYVPIRFVSDALNKNVRYDSASKTIYITDKTTTAPVTDTHNGELFKMKEIEQFNTHRKTIYVDGVKYADTIVIEPKGKISFNLEGKYKKLTFLNGFADSTYTGQSGGEIIISTDKGVNHVVPTSIDSDSIKSYTYDVTGVKTITFFRSGEKAHAIIINGKVE